jgi:osmotically-inducible protein OsmY
MYLLDPGTGKGRRALVRDKARSYWQRTGDLISKTARDASNRTRGLLVETRTRLRSADEPDDSVVTARVRAQIGHVVSNAGALGVTAHQGRVTLSGPIPAHEVEKLLSTVESVPGVTTVVNQLEVHSETGRISGVQGRNTVG